MKTHDLIQGTEEWHQHRAEHYNASYASAMMGASPYMSRSELVKYYSNGVFPEPTPQQQLLFEKGHRAEEAARPMIEQEFNLELFPVVATCDSDIKLSASFDGLTMDETVIWECKLFSQDKAMHVGVGKVPPQDYWQCIHQMVVNPNCQRLIYTLSDETGDKRLSCELTRQPEDEKRLLDGWAQFIKDVASYQPGDTPEPEAAGKAPESLPALRIEVEGMVRDSNLPAFREHALAVFEGINTDLQTDQDFADAEKTVKWCKEVEDRLEQAKRHALSQTESIDELFRTIDSVREEARAKRLELDKLVKNRKDAIRGEILREAQTAFSAHIGQINATLGGKVVMPEVKADFAGAMKGKKTVTSLRSAVDDEMARAKIEANGIADKIRLNLETLRNDAKGYETMFADAQSLVLKDNEDLKAVIKARITEHKEAEAKREAEKKAAEAAKEQQDSAHAPSAPEPTATGEGSKAPEAPRVAECEGKTAPEPTDQEIIDLVAGHYGVSTDTALVWILGVKERRAA